MKKRVFALLLSFLCIFSATCFAGNTRGTPLPQERMALGGLHVADTMEYVQSIYGEPESEESGYSQGTGTEYAVWEYSDSVKIHFRKNESTDEYYIKNIMVTADNGFSTPDGIKVGMDEKVLPKTYGEPFLHQRSNKGYETYRYQKTVHKYIYLVFIVSDGKIIKINLGFDN